jgi:hypothetical protein
MDMHARLEEFYLDWVNNYISIAHFARAYGMEEGHARQLLNLAKVICERGSTHS